MLKITNTLSGEKENFKPLHNNNVNLYVCGVTPYDHAHIGHGRSYVAFDVLYRLLLFLGYDVTYCRNFTDIDDKLIKRAEKELGNPLRYAEIAQKYIASFENDMALLNCLPPTYSPRVTENIDEIIDFIQGLIDKGKAYVANGDVYYDISSFEDYGKLSKQKIDELRAGNRVDVRAIKKDPLDFALWKSEKEGTFWKSPWGYGRPGWHIECSALANKYLGPEIDIHGGGMDLIFPHHENEIAQSEGLHEKPFARYWLHNAFVRIDKEKMSKSLGNFFTLQQVFEKFDPMVIRFYFVSHQYRAPLDFAFQHLEVAEKTYKKLCNVFVGHNCPEQTPKKLIEMPLIKKMITFLCDDLNTPGMWGVIFEHLSEISQDETLLCAVKQVIQQVLGLTLKPLPEKEIKITPEIKALLEKRAEARAQKDYKTADEIRDQLMALGVEVHDKKSK